MSKVNPEDAPEGYIAVPLPEINPCDACAFIKQKDTCHGNRKCTPSVRQDYCHVIFKKKPKGMTFEEILPLLRQGKEVRRKAWDENSSIKFNEKEDLVMEAALGAREYWGATIMRVSNLNATDWEEYKEDSK